MAWREALLRNVGPGFLGGLTFGRWLRLLRENRFAVTPSCWPRAMTIFFQSAQNSVFHWIDERRVASVIDDVDVPPPLFVLGHWRSGTTYLHNLLTVDERFGFPNNFQAVYPATFLTAESLQSSLMNFFLPRRRPMDNVEWNMQSPQEEEFALCNSTFQSPCMGWAFPNRQEFYDKYLTFREVQEHEILEWKQAFMRFLKKLTWKLKKPLILKSPPNTCRIKLLLEMFPDAKFIHIHRNPYDVFPSFKKTYQANVTWHRLQPIRPNELEDWILRQYREMYEVYFEERSLVPAENFHEVCYEELERDPLGQIQNIYEELNLPEFTETQPALQSYINSISGYQKNRFPELPAELKDRIAEEWGMSFEQWGYPK